MNKRVLLAAAFSVFAAAASGCAASPAATPSSSASAPSSSAAAGSSSASASDSGWALDTAGATGRIKAAGLSVLNMEGTAEHYHAHLDVFVDGKPVAVPPGIGFSVGADGKADGISALHTHEPDGVVHIEAAQAGQRYTLGQVLTEWGVLDGSNQTPGSPHGGTDGWTVYVNGAKQSGSIRDVQLKAHQEIVLAYGTAPSPLPSTFKFPDGE